MLAVIKRVINTGHACTSTWSQKTAQQLLCKTVNFISPELWTQQAKAELNFLQDFGSL